MLEFEQLEKLRLENKNLLERLKVKQEEFCKKNPGKREKAKPRSSEEILKNGTDDSGRSGSGEEDQKDSVRLMSVQNRVAVAASPKTTTTCSLREVSCTGELQKVQSSASLMSGDISIERPQGAGQSSVYQQKIPIRDSVKFHNLVYSPRFSHLRSLQQNRQKMIPGLDGSMRCSNVLKSYLQSGGKRSALVSADYAEKLLDEGNNRQKNQLMEEVKKPTSILITPLNDDTQKEAGCVTFLSSPKDSSVPAGSWSVRPLLGYDWIAGLLEVDSSLWEKSEQYFSELNEFRHVNRDECVQEHLELDILDISAAEEDKDISLNSHPCVYCYRVNKRLFLNPMNSESCPVCKTKRNQHRSMEEEAYVRVSFPRSTLLPPYKYKVHRRKSFDATDSLALLSHCSAGWESSILCSDSNLSSLDLRTLVKPRTDEKDLHNQSHLQTLLSAGMNGNHGSACVSYTSKHEFGTL